MSIPTDRLVAEALAKSGLLWIRSIAGEAPVWFASVDGIAYVVSGEGEQASPDHDGVCEVIARSKESRARLISFDAVADRMSPEDDDWAAATSALKAGRLNAPAGDLVERWARSGCVTRIRPDLRTVVLRGQLLSGPDQPQPTDSATTTAAASTESADSVGVTKVSE